MKDRKQRVRYKSKKVSSRNRLSVFRSNNHIYAQLIDDSKGITLASSSSLEQNIKDMKLIYNGNFYGGLKYEFYSENCCGWEVGFDDKFLFSNFREPTHWCLGNYWDFHNEFNDSPNQYSYGNLY